jgi:hypothetical protein
VGTIEIVVRKFEAFGVTTAGVSIELLVLCEATVTARPAGNDETAYVESVPAGAAPVPDVSSGLREGALAPPPPHPAASNAQTTRTHNLGANTRAYVARAEMLSSRSK